ncbi:unnamed protein product [Spirodela intermedia]|uniref:Uncharacterized protein n=1 Tax=Spirodela intermedia TaxID=51605 RepID=A0A7I8L9V6_SPIIN|nr:unnamed protein product [Spirodela intermedia]
MQGTSPDERCVEWMGRTNFTLAGRHLQRGMERRSYDADSTRACTDSSGDGVPGVPGVAGDTMFGMTVPSSGILFSVSKRNPRRKIIT